MDDDGLCNPDKTDLQSELQKNPGQQKIYSIIFSQAV